MLKHIIHFLLASYLLFDQVGSASPLPSKLSSSAEMSILVASPSTEEVYTLYGHAGYRVKDPTHHLDVTFNYGIFHFGDDFIFRFLRGATDYMVIPQYTEDYMNEYLGRGSDITELVLNLNPDEVTRAWDYLLNNIRTENRTYRYHFFKDNCSTRPLWIVDMATGGLIPQQKRQPLTLSWRDEINKLEAPMPWLVFATDLLLGSPTDKPMNRMDKAFSPRYLEELLRSSRKTSGDQVLRQVLAYKVDSSRSSIQTFGSITPALVFGLLLVITLVTYGGSLRYKYKVPRFIDASLFGFIGLGGVCTFYIAVLSEHPFVSPNYNLWVIHPLHLLVGSPFCLLYGRKPWAVWYHFVNFVATAFFLLVAWLLPQHINLAVYFIALSLLVVSGVRSCDYLPRCFGKWNTRV